MLLRNKKYSTLILLLLFVNILCAQDIKQDLQAIKNAMGVSTFSASIDCKIYLNNKQSESSRISYFVKGKNYKIEAGKVMKINNGKLNLLLDNENKKLIVSKSSEKFIDPSNTLPLDSLLSNASNIIYKPIGNNIGKYTLDLKKGAEKRIEIEFALNSFQIKRIYIVYREPELDENNKQIEKALELIYISFIANPKLSDAYFLTNTYVVKKGKEFIAINKYSQYQLFDLYNKN